jgi:hypothetical protein
LENRGAFNYSSGAFSGRLLNYGTMSLSDTFTFGNGLMQTAGATPINLSSTQSLTLNGAGLDNQGTITLSGGTLSGTTLNNNATLSGYGTITTGLTNSSTGNVTLTGGTTMVTGNVTNYGTMKNMQTTVTWAGSFTNAGAYISDPGTQYFTDLVIEPGGYLSGGAGDLWSLSGNFSSQSTQNLLWNTRLSDLAFTGGTSHQLYLTGADLGASMAGYNNNFAWGSLDLTGQSLNLLDGNDTQGGALYLGKILGLIFAGDTVTDITSIVGLNLYYDSSQNPDLGGLTYNLSGGGFLAPVENPVPLPASAWMLLSGLAGLGILRMRGRAQKG